MNAPQILSIDIEWNDSARISGSAENSLSDDDYVALRDHLDLIELPPLDKRSTFYAHNAKIGTFKDVETLNSFRIPVTISRVRGLYQEHPLTPMLPPSDASVQIVNLAIPNAALFSVQSLRVLENECTEAVQSALDKGWRIVAVCPPNDTRRPTYILGHFDKDQYL